MAEEWQRAGRREGRAGFCRAAASRGSRPGRQPAAVKPGLAKLGVALTPSLWHLLLATSTHPAAASAQPPSSLPGPIQPPPALSFSSYWSAKAFHIQPGPIHLGDVRISHPSSP